MGADAAKLALSFRVAIVRYLAGAIKAEYLAI